MKNNKLSGLRFKQFYKGEMGTYNYIDSEYIRTLRSHPKVNKELFETCNITRIEQEYWWENIYSKNNNKTIWLVYDEKLECPIGYISINADSLIHRRCQFDYVVSPEHNIEKYETRIIKWSISCSKRTVTNVHKLWLYIFPENERKIKMLNERFNFEIDGLITDFVNKDGQYRDVYLMSLLIT